ncbi:receptor-like protein 7 [Juglans regia]|uniref:Receptor-like protein 7 n=3 Tax=Juglans regia TaxID=51240 RepID=A0A6P9ECS1_JUGRE|nr:receptor-like protein 7 [Juglans regia]
MDILHRLDIPVLFPKPKRVRVVKWHQPPQGWVKLNTDGSSFGNPGTSGVGGVIRDEDGRLLLAYSVPLGLGTNNFAEFSSLLEGVRRCHALGFYRVQIETDSQLVVNWIVKNKCPIWYLEDFWEDLQEHLNSLEYTVTHIFREGNVVADFLAKCGAEGLNSDWSDIHMLPSLLRGLLRMDKLDTEALSDSWSKLEQISNLVSKKQSLYPVSLGNSIRSSASKAASGDVIRERSVEKLFSNLKRAAEQEHKTKMEPDSNVKSLKNKLVFNDALSAKLVHWNDSANCCSWEGVTCNEGRVIGLDLSNESISGVLDNSSSLFNLHHLQKLNLAYNEFDSSQIPSQFTKLSNLTYLNLSTAGFAGQIPLEISHLKRLATLDLSIHSYRSTYLLMPEKPNLSTLVQNLSGLRELHLDGNLQSLSVIHLADNQFFVPVPEFFADFKNLTSLSFTSSKLNGKFPEKIFQIPTLQRIELSGNSMLQGSLSEFPWNGNLRTLELGGTFFSGTLSDSIGNLKMLAIVDLYSCNFNGSIPKSMATLTQLVYLDMSYNNFTGPIPSFSMAKRLTEIYLTRNDLTGKITSTQWKELRNLEILDLGYNSLEGGLPISLFSLPLLLELRLSNNRFSGQLDEFSNVSSHPLYILDLSNNNLEGPVPMSVFEL